MKVRIYDPSDSDLPAIAQRVLAIMTSEATTGYEKYLLERAKLKNRRRQQMLDLHVEIKQEDKIISYAR